MTNEINNASQKPRIFYARHMQPGIAKYENETILVDTDGVKALVASGAGIPVYIQHKDVNLKEIKSEAAGYVSDSFYNELDGWAWFKFIAVDDEAHAAISKGWAVSNAYKPTEWGYGGTKNNCPFDREVKNGEFSHLAIVPDPRYEGATIMTPEEFKIYQEGQKAKLAELQNSNPKGKTMFKLFKNSRQEVTSVDEDTVVEFEDGTSATVAEMRNAVKKNEASTAMKATEMEELAKKYKNIKKNKKHMKNEDDYEEMDNAEESQGDQDDEGDDEIGDDKKPDRDYKKKDIEKKNKKHMKNEAEVEEDEDSEEDEEWEDGKKGVKENKEKKNSVSDDERYFNELRNANFKAESVAPSVETGASMLQRGQQRYGKQVKK